MRIGPIVLVPIVLVLIVLAAFAVHRGIDVTVQAQAQDPGPRLETLERATRAHDAALDELRRLFGDQNDRIQKLTERVEKLEQQVKGQARGKRR